MHETSPYTAFADHERVASGDRIQAALAVKALLDSGDRRTMLIFNDRTGAQVDVDLRGTNEEVEKRLPSERADGEEAGGQPERVRMRRSPGRPKLGVVGREVTLLPRHWEWLNAQPSGASVALRKLVEAARRDSAFKDIVRSAQGAAYRFMSAIAGNEPGFEEASRSLFAGNRDSFEKYTEQWPQDVRDHARALAAPAFEPGGGSGSRPR
ncbi:MAG: DUF2239 family protein [Actinobacteria bacterium]|nr:DUF2239 family protein [Actinomycetota bacterium]